MNDSLKYNINEKVLMKIHCDKISGYKFQPNQSARLLK